MQEYKKKSKNIPLGDVTLRVCLCSFRVAKNIYGAEFDNNAKTFFINCNGQTMKITLANNQKMKEIREFAELS